MLLSDRCQGLRRARDEARDRRRGRALSAVV